MRFVVFWFFLVLGSVLVSAANPKSLLPSEEHLPEGFIGREVEVWPTGWFSRLYEKSWSNKGVDYSSNIRVSVAVTKDALETQDRLNTLLVLSEASERLESREYGAKVFSLMNDKGGRYSGDVILIKDHVVVHINCVRYSTKCVWDNSDESCGGGSGIQYEYYPSFDLCIKLKEVLGDKLSKISYDENGSLRFEASEEEKKKQRVESLRTQYFSSRERFQKLLYLRGNAARIRHDVVYGGRFIVLRGYDLDSLLVGSRFEGEISDTVSQIRRPLSLYESKGDWDIYLSELDSEIRRTAVLAEHLSAEIKEVGGGL